MITDVNRNGDLRTLALRCPAPTSAELSAAHCASGLDTSICQRSPVYVPRNIASRRYHTPKYIVCILYHSHLGYSSGRGRPPCCIIICHDTRRICFFVGTPHARDHSPYAAMPSPFLLGIYSRTRHRTTYRYIVARDAPHILWGTRNTSGFVTTRTLTALPIATPLHTHNVTASKRSKTPHTAVIYSISLARSRSPFRLLLGRLAAAKLVERARARRARKAPAAAAPAVVRRAAPRALEVAKVAERVERRVLEVLGLLGGRRCERERVAPARGGGVGERPEGVLQFR